MKNTICSIVTMLLCALPTQAKTNHPWSEFEGCYKTISRNGYENPEDQQIESSIRFSEESFMGLVQDQNGKKIPGLDLMLFLKFDEADNTLYYDIHPLFSAFGVYSEKGKVKSHDITDRFIYDDGGGNPQGFTLNSHTEIERIGCDRIRLQVQRQIPEIPSGEMDIDDEFVLEKTTDDCAMNSSRIVKPMKIQRSTK